MASARQISKDVALRSATNRQKLKQQLSSERGGSAGGSGTTDVRVPGGSGDKSDAFLYVKEELVLTVGENFHSRTMVLVQQAARSSNEASFWDIADGIYKDALGYLNKEAQLRAFALLMYHQGLEDVNSAETLAKLSSRLATLEVEGVKFRSPLLKQLQEDFTSRATWQDSDPARWLAFSCYLCVLFRYLKIGDNYINALAEPVFTCLDSLLTDKDASDEEMTCGCNQLKELGLILDDLKASQMDTLINTLKEKLLGPQASHFSRLLLLEVIELRASGWKLNDTQRAYYSEVIC